MKARIIFYVAAVVALVLILASVPSHATERRDPFIIQDSSQTQAARSLSLAHATSTATKPVDSSAHKKKSAKASHKRTNQSGKSTSNTGSSKAAK